MPRTPYVTPEHNVIKNLDFIEEYFCFEKTDSTNSFAKELKNFPVSGITVIRALKQSGGRGRLNKTFFSDHSGGLWVSVVTPVKSVSDHFIYNRALSLAVCETLKNIDSRSSEKIKIKWPNDIYWGERKTAGILLENISANPNVIIAGLGLNVNIAREDFPAELRRSATSVLIETGQIISQDFLLESILKAYRQFSNKESDMKSVHERYVENLYKKGRAAVIDSLSGTFLTVEPDGQLRMQTAHGDKLYSCGTLRFSES
ncbi:MAG: biotin--[acetyl-CoA-carboxylase] ligase [Chitinispirillales bacterium]|jgi:BirA family biotin operon repressor/biotin-[acetyl-CoA-carboxylase] ligase|nr:biotin--[acetyl-CoA-carboxylase] ligase [Chitinispirillales bacterium]